MMVLTANHKLMIGSCACSTISKGLKNNNESSIDEEIEEEIDDAKEEKRINDGVKQMEEMQISSSLFQPALSCIFLRKALLEIFPADDFEKSAHLGEGFFSDVYKVRQKSTEHFLVLKMGKQRSRSSPWCSDLSQFSSSNRHRQKANTLREAQLMRKLHHPNVLGFRGVCVDRLENSWNLHLLVDFCNTGSLSRLILDGNTPFHWRLRCSLALDMARGMNYVHESGFMHRDLTSTNVLLHHSDCRPTKALIADFGLSCPIPNRADPPLTPVGTPYWMAPECLQEEWYCEKADVFSFGVIVCQLMARIDADPDMGMYRTPAFGLDYVRYASICPPETPTEMLRLAFTCCLINPASRPSFCHIVEQSETILKDVDSGSKRRRWKNRRKTCRPISLDQSTLIHSLYPSADLGRSLSDVNIRPRSLTNCTKLNRTLTSVIDTDEEENDFFVSKNDNALSNCRFSWQQLAQSVADEDPDYEPSYNNPFIDHAKFRSGRRQLPAVTGCPLPTVLPFFTPSTLPKHAPRKGGLRPLSRCCSLPCRSLTKIAEISSPSTETQSGLSLTFRNFDDTFSSLHRKRRRPTLHLDNGATDQQQPSRPLVDSSHSTFPSNSVHMNGRKSPRFCTML